ncbi:hypothetical protein Tco_1074905 [Tanacetum coccineum]
MDKCLALADLGASINLMPLSVCKKLSLSELTPTCTTLELADRLISQPLSIAEDVRSFLKTGRALIDVYEGELTLRVGKEAVTFNLDQTSRYLANYNACEEYSQEVLGFSDVIASGSSRDFILLEEADTFLALEDDPTSPKVDHSYYDSEGDILLLEAFLNDDPSLPTPTQGNYLPEIRKELKIYEAKNDKSLIDEPTKVELKDLPPHLERSSKSYDPKDPRKDQMHLVRMESVGYSRAMTFGGCNAPGTCPKVSMNQYSEKNTKVQLSDEGIQAFESWRSLGNVIENALYAYATMLGRNDEGSKSHYSTTEHVLKPPLVRDRYIAHVFSSMAPSSYPITSGQTSRLNGHRMVKQYLGLGRAPIGCLDLQIFPKDKWNSWDWFSLVTITSASWRQPMLSLVDCPRFLKPLMLAVLSFVHKSFKSSASFGKSNILI